MTSASDSMADAERNYLETWRRLVVRAPGGVVEEHDRVLLVGVPAPVAFFNTAFVKPPADPIACIDTVRAFYSKRDSPFMLRFREGHSRPTSADINAVGLTAAGTSPLMIADITDIAPPPDLDIRPVDASNWTEHVATIATAFGLPLDLLPGIFDPALLDDETYVGRNVYVDGEIASTAALIVTGKVAGVYNVATPERFRRRGLGEAATSAVIAEGARRGCTTTTLQASEMGYPIYERMGFRTVVHWRNFVSS